MSTDALSSIAGFALVLLLAPLVPGVATRMRAWLTGRRGSPVWQVYADVWKLLHRGIVYSRTTTPTFRLSPIAVLATVIAAASLVPFDGRTSLLSFPGDILAFAYVLALGRFALVLGALDTGSSFEGMGASREVTFAALVEFALFLSLAALGVATHTASLSGMLGPALASQWTGAAPALTMIAGALFVLLLAECSRSPVDDPTTHLELTMIHEVMILDHSGPDLGVIVYANAVKLSMLGAVVAHVAWPTAQFGAVARLVALVASVLAVGVLVGVVEASTARVRLPKVPLVVASAAALSALGMVLLLG
jgi:formate hydrogenlyase subunit 4